MDTINPISMQLGQLTPSPVKSEVDFSNWIMKGVREIDGSIKSAEAAAKNVISGDIENLHHVMSRISEAELKLQFALQVRDKALEAYQEVLRMQL